MTKIVLINKNGDIKTQNVKQLVYSELYKKCGFKIDKGFAHRTTWDISISKKNYCIELWARNEGKAGTENKYDFPPPVDSKLYFGTCCLVRVDKVSNELISLSQEEWGCVYEKLFGGFEDIEEEEEYSEDELANVPKNMKTKSGYLKDNFVVEDNDDCNEDDEDDDDDEIIDEDDEDAIIGEDNNDNESNSDSWISDDSEKNEENNLHTEYYIYSDEDN
tara:strand:+ start:84 stop:740 length:657 start_codon:yes stop_codon:yes gene_type:complete